MGNSFSQKLGLKGHAEAGGDAVLNGFRLDYNGTFTATLVTTRFEGKTPLTKHDASPAITITGVKTTFKHFPYELKAHQKGKTLFKKSLKIKLCENI